METKTQEKTNKKETKQKEIKLSDNQFEKLVNNIQQINFHKEEVKKLENSQQDMISLICEFNEVEFRDIKIELNIENKSLMIK